MIKRLIDRATQKNNWNDSALMIVAYVVALPPVTMVVVAFFAGEYAAASLLLASFLLGAIFAILVLVDTDS